MTPDIDLLSYDRYIVSYSGGKDSTALLLFLLDNGVPKERIELWHQEIDGRGPSLFDWEVTRDYCRKVGEAFGVPVLFQWKDGGFTREMLRRDALTAPVLFELPDGTVSKAGGDRGTPSTRLKFPQPSPDLRVRWCSAYLKIDVCATAIRHQERFRGIRTLVLSGERGEESPQRARYAVVEPDRADLRNGRNPRLVDRFRPIRDWKERDVWDILEKHRVRPHPCYQMGFGRCSCKFCVFGNATQFASAACVSPNQMDTLIRFEKDFGHTLKRDTDLASLIRKGRSYDAITDELKALATSYEYSVPVIVPEGETWRLPDGAFRKCGGPS